MEEEEILGKWNKQGAGLGFELVGLVAKGGRVEEQDIPRKPGAAGEGKGAEDRG